jgi:hypothetical protein
MKPDFVKIASGLKTITLTRLCGTGFAAVMAIHCAAETAQAEYERELCVLLERWKKEDPEHLVEPMRATPDVQRLRELEGGRFELRLRRGADEDSTLDARVILRRFPVNNDLLLLRCRARDADPHHPGKERPLLIAFARHAWECRLAPTDLPELLGPTALYAPSEGSFLSAYLSRYPGFARGMEMDTEFKNAVSTILDMSFSGQGETLIPHAKEELATPNATGNVASLLAMPEWMPGRAKILDAIIQWLEEHPSHLARKLPAVPWRWESTGWRNTAGIVHDDPIRFLADLFWLALPSLRIDPPQFELVDGTGCERDLKFMKSVLAEGGFLAERLDFAARDRHASISYDNWFREAELGFDYAALTARWRARHAIEISEPAQEEQGPIL